MSPTEVVVVNPDPAVVILWASGVWLVISAGAFRLGKWRAGQILKERERDTRLDNLEAGLNPSGITASSTFTIAEVAELVQHINKPKEVDE